MVWGWELEWEWEVEGRLRLRGVLEEGVGEWVCEDCVVWLLVVSREEWVVCEARGMIVSGDEGRMIQRVMVADLVFEMGKADRNQVDILGSVAVDNEPCRSLW